MKTDKKQLMQAIEAIKAKLAIMEEELNKPDEFKHFPSKGDEYYFYTNTGSISSNEASSDDLKVDAYKTREEAREAYNKAVALEKIKRRLVELQDDWKPTWEDYSYWNNHSYKHIIIYSYDSDMFEVVHWSRTKHHTLIPYIKTSDIANTIIKEMEDELKLIFDIA